MPDSIPLEGWLQAKLKKHCTDAITLNQPKEHVMDNQSQAEDWADKFLSQFHKVAKHLFTPTTRNATMDNEEKLNKASEVCNMILAKCFIPKLYMKPYKAAFSGGANCEICISDKLVGYVAIDPFETSKVLLVWGKTEVASCDINEKGIGIILAKMIAMCYITREAIK